MAANKNVIVLALNGRRQNVKVTPNTTILQVLEEVCKKHGYNSDEYDLKHYNKVLDPNAIFRFIGLPNNAQLEMVPCTKARSKSTVVIGIQLETGQRLMGEFTPDTTLAEVLQNVYPDQNYDSALLTYMHCEVHGTEALKNTTLKSLGLNNGKAVLRLMHRDPQQVKTQMHVSKPLRPSEQPSTSKENNEEESVNKNSNKILNIVTQRVVPEREELEVHSQSIGTKEEAIAQTENLNKNPITEEDYAVPSTSKNHGFTKTQTSTQSRAKTEIKDTVDIKFLGERNALVFNQATIQALPKDELPDDFYDLTVNDVKLLLKDAKRRREELEEAPLLTNVQRQLNCEKHTLSQLNKYQYTIIRVQFPDQFVLQGLFRPLEKVQTIKDFVKTYLNNPDSDFEIFTTPPKHVLNPDAYLVDENLVPSTIIYYSGPSSLKSDVKEKSVDPKDVEIQVARVRMSLINQENQSDTDVKDADTPSSKSSESSSKNKNKIPKWLKPKSK